MKIYQITQKMFNDDKTEYNDLIKFTGDHAFDWGGSKETEILLDFWKCYIPNKFSKEEMEFHENEILTRIKQVKPDIVRYYATWTDPSERFFLAIKALGIPLVITISDTLIFPNPPEVKLFQIADCFVIYESVSNYLRYRLLKEHGTGKNTVVCVAGNLLDARTFQKSNLEKVYDVGMLGSIEGIRANMIKYFVKELQKDNIGFYSKGGVSLRDTNSNPIDQLPPEFLTQQQYVETINKTKIQIVSQTVAERDQIKGKLFEFMACGAFVLVDRSKEYEMMIPDGLIIYYDSLQDCVDKIKYYLANESERESIALKARQWYLKTFDSARFWHDIYIAVLNKTKLPVLDEIEKSYQELTKRVNVHHELFLALKKIVETPVSSNSPIQKLSSRANLKSLVKSRIPIPVKQLIKRLIQSESR